MLFDQVEEQKNAKDSSILELHDKAGALPIFIVEAQVSVELVGDEAAGRICESVAHGEIHYLREWLKEGGALFLGQFHSQGSDEKVSRMRVALFELYGNTLQVTVLCRLCYDTHYEGMQGLLIGRERDRLRVESHGGALPHQLLCLFSHFLAELPHVVAGKLIPFLAALFQSHVLLYVADIVLQCLDVTLGIALLYGIERGTYLGTDIIEKEVLLIIVGIGNGEKLSTRQLNNKTTRSRMLSTKQQTSKNQQPRRKPTKQQAGLLHNDMKSWQKARSFTLII